MLYANGKTIPGCGSTVKEIKLPGKELLREGSRLSNAILKDDDAFGNLYDLWIAPCIEMMCEEDGSSLSSKLSLFYENAGQAERETFLTGFSHFIRGIPPYQMNIWPGCPDHAICQQVDEALPESSDAMKLRIKVVCIFLNVLPDQAFAEGINWNSAFLPDLSEAYYFEITEGMTFPLSFDQVDLLYPKTMHNAKDVKCRIEIHYRSDIYPVVFPPHGFLRVVFADEACSRLVSVKGNISFNRSEMRNAIVQFTKEEHISLQMYHQQYRAALELETGGSFSDAAADGQGGAVVLTNQGLYYTGEDKLIKQEILPIRVYGAGPQFVSHYADKTLRGGIRKRNGSLIERAFAVVENGDRSLLLKDEEGTWECVGGIAREIEEEKLVGSMLGRFGGDSFEESESSFMKLRSRYDGILEEI